MQTATQARKEVAMRVSLLLISSVAVGITPALHAQTLPPIHGVTGVVATDATIRDEHKAGNKIAVTTEDGVQHVYRAAKDLLVHGGKDGVLADLKPGTTVVVHYTAGADGESAHEIDRVGGSGLQTTEGTVTDINRGRKQITIRYDNGTTEKLTLTDRAAVDAGQDFTDQAIGTTRVVVYYSDDAGGKVAHYFKRKS
jgi:hypothetical protein